MILRWQYQSSRNTVRALFADRPIEMSFVTIGALLVIAYNAADYYASLVEAAPTVRGHWPRIAASGLAASAVLGTMVGYTLGLWASARARAPWISVLPWPGDAKKRAARAAALTMATICSAVPMLFGLIVTYAVRKPDVLLDGLVAAVAFLIPAAAAAHIGASDADLADEPSDPGVPPARQSWTKRLAVALDRSSPKWVGLWAQSENRPHVAAFLIGSLVILGGVAGVISIAQWQPWPSIVTAVIGGNLAFMATVNGQPLLSPALRSTSVGYVAVWLALIRVPAVMSLAWFASAAIPAILVSRHFGGESAGAVPLLVLLDVLFCASVALIPSSRQRAAILHVILLAVIIYQGLQYGVAYGVLAVAVMLGVVALLWSRARQRFRSNG